MVEALMTLVIVIVLLLGVCFIGSLILAKDTKEFHIHFGLLKGFDISGSFYESNSPQEHQQQLIIQFISRRVVSFEAVNFSVSMEDKFLW